MGGLNNIVGELKYFNYFFGRASSKNNLVLNKEKRINLFDLLLLYLCFKCSEVSVVLNYKHTIYYIEWKTLQINAISIVLNIDTECCHCHTQRFSCPDLITEYTVLGGIYLFSVESQYTQLLSPISYKKNCMLFSLFEYFSRK